MKEASSKNNIINLSGTYESNGFDIHDGPFSHGLTLVLDEKNSDFEHGYAGYQFTSFTNDGAVAYKGSLIANGNSIAVSFHNANPGQESDHGVVMGTITHDRDSKGISQMMIHNFYYQPEYKGGGNGTGTWVKVGG